MSLSVRLFTLLAPVVFTTAALGQTVPLTDAERQFLAGHPKVRLMVDRHYEPADFIDDIGNHSGMAADFLKLLTERTGLAFEPVPLTPEQRQELDPVKRGVDGVALSATSRTRSEFYHITEPLLEFPAYILTRQNVDRFLTPIDLNGQRVGVVAGYATEEYLRTNYPRITLVPFPTTDDGLKAVSFGEIEAFVAAIPVSTYWLEKEGFANLKVAGETGYIYRLGVTSRKDWPELNGILQKGVASITAEERDEIRRKWLNAPYEPLFRSRKFWVPVISGAAVLVGGLLVAGMWNHMLRKKVAERTKELGASETLYRTTLENVTDAVLLARADGTIVYASGGVKRVFDSDPEELTKSGRVADLIGIDQEKKATAGAEVLRDLECYLTVPGGGGRTVLVTAGPIRVRDAVRLYVCHDITDRQRMERQLRQSRTLESVGLLASGVAHDFNNLLQVIGGFTEIAGMAGLPEQERKGYLGRVSDATKRASGLTRQLLAFARRQPLDKTAVDVGAVTSELLGLSSGLVGKAVEVRYTPPTTPLRVTGDPTQIEQVLLNLLVNARDAMPKGGSITIDWDSCEVDAERAERVGVNAGRFVRLRVTDTGTGIPVAIRSKIFEAFFTTKAEGKGTGLGLAVVFGVAQEAGGFVDLTSEEGFGTTFEVLWPDAQNQAAPPTAG